MKMTKVMVDFGKPYAKQTEEAKKVLCEHDFYEVANLLGFKKRLKEFKKTIDRRQVVWYYNYRKRENS